MMEDGIVRENLIFLVVAVILAYGLYNTVGVTLDTSVPVVAVTSGSMEPHLSRGDMIVVQGRSFDRIAEEDIIVYQPREMPVPIIHRVVSKNATALQTRGDSNVRQYGFEKYVTPDEVLGTSMLAIPYIGYVKLVPTCAYLRWRYGQSSQLDLVCPPGQL